MPTGMMVLFGILTMWTAFLLVPVMIGLFFLDFVPGWSILGALVVAWLLIRISRMGHCKGIQLGAERHERLYQVLVENGAFLFSPPK